MNWRKFWVGLSMLLFNLLAAIIYLLLPIVKEISITSLIIGMMVFAFEAVAISLLISGLVEKEK